MSADDDDGNKFELRAQSEKVDQTEGDLKYDCERGGHEVHCFPSKISDVEGGKKCCNCKMIINERHSRQVLLTQPHTAHDDGRPVGHGVHLVTVLQTALAPLAERVGEDLDGVPLDDLHTAALLGYDHHHQQHEGDSHVARR